MSFNRYLKYLGLKSKFGLTFFDDGTTKNRYSVTLDPSNNNKINADRIINNFNTNVAPNNIFTISFPISYDLLNRKYNFKSTINAGVFDTLLNKRSNFTLIIYSNLIKDTTWSSSPLLCEVIYDDLYKLCFQLALPSISVTDTSITINITINPIYPLDSNDPPIVITTKSITLTFDTEITVAI
jgi:hypothetical protein